MADYYKLTPADFPPGEPALLMKRGMWWRPDGAGYTGTLLEAGLYPREYAITHAFGRGDENGRGFPDTTIAVPIRIALLDHGGFTREELEAELDRMKCQIAELSKYAPEKR